MLIINDRRDEAVRSEDIVHISQGTNCAVVAWTILCRNSKEPDIFLGRYESPEQAGKAFNQLVDALVMGDDILFRMPRRDDPGMKVDSVSRSSGLAYRQGKTNGKNH